MKRLLVVLFMVVLFALVFQAHEARADGSSWCGNVQAIFKWFDFNAYIMMIGVENDNTFPVYLVSTYVNWTQIAGQLYNDKETFGCVGVGPCPDYDIRLLYDGDDHQPPTTLVFHTPYPVGRHETWEWDTKFAGGAPIYEHFWATMTFTGGGGTCVLSAQFGD